mmetsp:Transcript_38765/g.101321  ORF Transcript_38765/g.101321 Transcript_38765/m.101321 type:complete len:346 (+) Transcript_38765:2252-3289(+)
MGSDREVAVAEFVVRGVRHGGRGVCDYGGQGGDPEGGGDLTVDSGGGAAGAESTPEQQVVLRVPGSHRPLLLLHAVCSEGHPGRRRLAAGGAAASVHAAGVVSGGDAAAGGLRDPVHSNSRVPHRSPLLHRPRPDGPQPARRRWHPQRPSHLRLGLPGVGSPVHPALLDRYHCDVRLRVVCGGVWGGGATAPGVVWDHQCRVQLRVGVRDHACAVLRGAPAPHGHVAGNRSSGGGLADGEDGCLHCDAVLQLQSARETAAPLVVSFHHLPPGGVVGFPGVGLVRCAPVSAKFLDYPGRVVQPQQKLRVERVGLRRPAPARGSDCSGPGLPVSSRSCAPCQLCLHL